MYLQTMLDQRNITKYHLSKISGVPKTTVIDICSGKSSLDRCSAKTVYQIAQALGCTMEELMMLDTPTNYNTETGLPLDKSYLECNLPAYLQESIERMKKAWHLVDSGKTYLRWDCDFCELQSDINTAETSNLITEEQAWYLRETYLRIEKKK